MPLLITATRPTLSWLAVPVNSTSYVRVVRIGMGSPLTLTIQSLTKYSLLPET